jgi:hypothetical protein
MTDPTSSLAEVLTTDELASRCSRPPDFERVNGAFNALLSACLYTPEAVLQRFAELLLDLCNAHSAGVSILEEENGRRCSDGMPLPAYMLPAGGEACRVALVRAAWC